MNSIEKLKVKYNSRYVGTLANYENRYAVFEYDKDWLYEGFSISPFSLPLEKQIFIPKLDPFDGLHGVFADSLPDGWGRLLVDRLMLQHGINPHTLGNLDRLAIIDEAGMGALSYEPTNCFLESSKYLSFDEIAKECINILNENDSNDLDFLFKNGGSSGGARPKIMTKINNEDWIIKFPSSNDPKNIGKQEYDYSLCASKCGIDIEETKLFESKICDGYFGTRRFDRRNKRKIHMVSASGLLETSHRIPNLDYDILMKLTLMITKDMNECLKLFRLMCFNVFAHNRDDHSKNFSYLYKEEEKRWILSPAYDLTYSYSIGGEHATTIHGEGRNPDMNEILAVAKGIGINLSIARKTANNIRDIIYHELKEYII